MRPQTRDLETLAIFSRREESRDLTGPFKVRISVAHFRVGLPHEFSDEVIIAVQLISNSSWRVSGQYTHGAEVKVNIEALYESVMATKAIVRTNRLDNFRVNRTLS